jgi:glycine C-acetyltransferase
MPTDRIHGVLAAQLQELDQRGSRKGAEKVVTEVLAAQGARGPRYRIEGQGEREFLRMNSNGYLGASLREELIEAERSAAESFGVGPGAVRFISGTYVPHVELEQRLAQFHGRPAAMILSSAYATVVGVIPSLVTKETALISDELNHNCIINAMRLSRPAERLIYKHNDLAELEAALEQAAATCRRALVVTDGIFSMRGDHAPLHEIAQLVRSFDDRFDENAILLVDDSHGVGAFGTTGRGTEEVCGVEVDILVATLGKAFGVNGGYVVGDQILIDYLRESSPLYIYSNPITPAEAAAALAAVELVDSEQGLALLLHLRAMTQRFESGLVGLGYETIPGEHPVVPLMVRDTEKTAALVKHLFDNGVLATGLNYPVVPRGDEEIRFQISAEHTEADIDQALAQLESFSPHREAGRRSS